MRAPYILVYSRTTLEQYSEACMAQYKCHGRIMPIAVWLAVKDINIEMHETLDSITTYH